MDTGRRAVTEDISLEILARLPLRSIARFKSVCKRWKSVIESPYFRRLFASMHKDSSSSWSFMFTTRECRSIREAIGFHGCETWDLPKSLGSYIFPFQPYPNLPALDYYYRGSSNGLILIEVSLDPTENIGHSYKSFVGNPVLQQWVEIPHPPQLCPTTSLVTHVENGIVSSFKVIMTVARQRWRVYMWKVYIYSSETGLWTFKKLRSSVSLRHYGTYSSVNLNGMLYLCKKCLCCTGPGALIAYDFYGPEEADNQCRVIPLPFSSINHRRRCLTTSQGDVFYVEIVGRILKVWRLNNNEWQLSGEEIDMECVGYDVECIPVAMNPFDTDIVYLWSIQHCRFVSGNLRTNEFIVHQESENWSSSKGCFRINTSGSLEYMEDARDLFSAVFFSQFVLPQWMDPVPRPPN